MQLDFMRLILQKMPGLRVELPYPTYQVSRTGIPTYDKKIRQASRALQMHESLSNGAS
jgi:hypothetical protein